MLGSALRSSRGHFAEGTWNRISSPGCTQTLKSQETPGKFASWCSGVELGDRANNSKAEVEYARSAKKFFPFSLSHKIADFPPRVMGAGRPSLWRPSSLGHCCLKAQIGKWVL
uniref:Uncharacterized protein n=1 Tax=Peronospora matthiolae TaxID=2874970 RepID=A0AAV1TRU3_9STRA